MTEVFLRLNPLLSRRYSFNQFVIKEDPIYTTFNRRREDYQTYRPSDILGYEFIPNVNPMINSLGMIGKERSIEKDKGTYRILVLGDSITAHNWYVESLEAKLNNSNPKLKYKFELWNTGVPGYQVTQYANYLKFKGIKYNPDMVIIGFCLNDLQYSYHVYYKDRNRFTICYNPAIALSKKIYLNGFLFKHSYLHRLLILKIENSLTDAQAGDSYLGVRSYDFKLAGYDNKAEGVYYLKIIQNICEERKTALLGVVFPYLKPLSEYTDSELYNYNKLIEMLKALMIDYIDLYNYFPEVKRYSLRLHSFDYAHPSIEGHEIVADAIYAHLLENYFAPLHTEHLTELKDLEGIALSK